jgi:adenosylmethionine-8-amino-7-oxononanoate aminotransferase
VAGDQLAAAHARAQLEAVHVLMKERHGRKPSESERKHKNKGGNLTNTSGQKSVDQISNCACVALGHLREDAAQLFVLVEACQEAVGARRLHASRVEPVRKRVKRRRVLRERLQVEQELCSISFFFF